MLFRSRIKEKVFGENQDSTAVRITMSGGVTGGLEYSIVLDRNDIYYDEEILDENEVPMIFDLCLSWYLCSGSTELATPWVGPRDVEEPENMTEEELMQSLKSGILGASAAAGQAPAGTTPTSGNCGCGGSGSGCGGNCGGPGCGCSNP